jgi:hypothetical protein
MAFTAFQANAFQNDAFQIVGGVTPPPVPQEPGGAITRGQFSKGKWREFKERKKKEYAERVYVLSRDLGLAKILRDRRIEAGLADFYRLVQQLEQQQKLRAFARAHGFAGDVVHRMAAIQAFNQQAHAAMQHAVTQKQMHDMSEEEEALELATMMEDADD